LLKIHGALDELAFNDSQDLLKLASAEGSICNLLRLDLVAKVDALLK